ncbi:MAG: hypothetical protein QOF68_2128 [Gaiellales bacterium]|nr:hypothetical protein [Gaiellales bacterium]
MPIMCPTAIINRLFPVFVSLAALAAAGCGAATSTGAGSSPTTPGLTYPTGSRDVVLRVSTGGGYVPSEVAMTTVPEFTLYGDGTVIVPGAVMAIYPGPAMSPLMTFKLSEEEVQALLASADRSGLLDGRPVDYGDMGSVGVSDMPTTTVTLNADGKQVKRDAYALSADATGDRLTPAQREARIALSRFVQSLPQGSSPQPYTPSAIAVNIGPFNGERMPDATPMVWPLEGDLASDGKRVSSGLPYRCLAVTGEDTRTLLETLSGANDQTEWLAQPAGDDTFRLVVRPVLPDENGCAV